MGMKKAMFIFDIIVIICMVSMVIIMALTTFNYINPDFHITALLVLFMPVIAWLLLRDNI